MQVYASVYEALRDNPRKLFQIVKDPDFQLDYHRMAWIEVQSFINIEKQTFARKRFHSIKHHNPKRSPYWRYLTVIERQVLNLEITYMKNSYLEYAERLTEIARVMSIKHKSHFTWNQIKSILDDASEVIADVERDNFIKSVRQKLLNEDRNNSAQKIT